VAVLAFGGSDDRRQVGAIDRFAFEEQIDDLMECVEVRADEFGGGGFGLA
jgi:hypothetical protein